MTRYLSPALALALFALPVDAQRGEPLADAKTETEPALAREVPDAAAEVPADAEVFEGEESDFCGGEETVVDLAYGELHAGNPARAKELLVGALKRGEVEPWQRAFALVTLAEAQLVLGQHWAAVRNYQRALREDPDDVGAPARVGIAAALYLQHRRPLALDASREAASMACATGYSQVECYAAHLLVASSTRDGDERATATDAARALRVAHADYAESFDAVEVRLGIALPYAAGAP